MSKNNTKFYIDGEWVDPAVPQLYDVINPATEEVAGQVSMGSAADVDRAVVAARRAFPSYAATSRDERIALLKAEIERLQEAATKKRASKEAANSFFKT